jgi:hypothetical protein
VSYARSGPNSAYDEAIRILADALDRPSLQISHEATLARDFAQSGNRNAAAGSSGRYAASGHTRGLHVVKTWRKIALAVLRFLSDW